MNEQLKSTINYILPIYVKLFNLIFDGAIILESWALGQIKPIYKNKDNPNLPKIYRPIMLWSCFGKLFISIINNRLTKFSEKFEIINWTQAGLRKKFSTTENSFILKSLIDIAHSTKRKIYCCFIDYKQAFDTVCRAGLWSKLIQLGVCCKCFD